MTAEPPNSRQIVDLIIVARVVLGKEFLDKHWKVFVMGCWTGYYPGILLDMAEAVKEQKKENEEVIK